MQRAWKRKKIKALADAEAYSKQKIMHADGALEKKLDTYKALQEMWGGAFAQDQGDLVPQFQTGVGNAKNGDLELMDIMSAKTAMDLNMKGQKK